MTTTPVHVDIPALARRLSETQRQVLEAAAAGYLRRDRFIAADRAYVHRWYPSAVTRTARSLTRLGLVDRPGRDAPSPEGQRDPSYTLTATGQAVLDHLAQVKP